MNTLETSLSQGRLQRHAQSSVGFYKAYSSLLILAHGML